MRFDLQQWARECVRISEEIDPEGRINPEDWEWDGRVRVPPGYRWTGNKLVPV